MPNSQQSPFYSSISRLQRLYSKGLAHRLEAYKVKPGYLDILHNLWREDGITQKQLHQKMDIEQATLSNTLKRMERDELVTRVRNRKDRRATNIFLTDTGRDLERTVTAAIDDLQSVVNQGLTINDKKYFNRILRQMSEQLATDQEDTYLVLVDEVVE